MAVAVAVVAMASGTLPFLSPLSTPAQATPATDGNPDLPASCGIDVTLVLDNSGSIDATEAGQVRAGAQAFANALVGTPSRLKTTYFANTSRGIAANGSSTADLNNVVFRDPALYAAPTSGAGSGGTNWDDGLEIVRRSPGGGGDLVVFLTDGDPTFRNTTTPDGHQNNGTEAISGTGSTTSAADLSQAVTESNLIKASGAHMFGIGVGITSAASKQRLNDVTGDEEMIITGGVPTPPFGEADFVIAPNFSDIQSIVSAFVKDLCGNSLNVTKYLQKADGTTVKADGASPWTFTNTLDPAPDQWNNPPTATGATASLTSNGNGGVSFVWDQGQAPGTHVADLVETPKTGWVYNGAICTKTDFSGGSGTPTPLFNTVGANAPGVSGNPSDLLDLVVESNRAVNCQVFNREVRTSTVQVAKQTVPAGLAGDFGFALTQGATTVDTVSGVAHGETATFTPIAPGTYSVAETSSASGFTQTGATCDNLATPTVETTSPSGLVVSEAQNWRCTFTNTAQNGSITIVKNSVGADGTFDFRSNIPGHATFSVATSGGTGSTSAFPVPVGTYNVDEETPTAWDLTSATCTGGDSPGAVNVGPGEDVTCTFTNTAPAPSIRVIKTAGVPSVQELGGPVTYTVTVINTSVEPVTISSLTDSIDGGPQLDLTSTGGAITATTCNTLVGTTLAIGASGSCTFTAQVSGLGNTSETDIVTAKAKDSEDNVATATDDATVDIVGIAPTMEVTKTPDVASLTEPGGPVTYTVGIKNTGVEPLTIDSLSDEMESDPPMDITMVGGGVTATTCDALVGTSVAAGATVTCTFTFLHTGHTTQYLDGTINDTVTVVGHDDDGPVTATGSAEVALLDALPAVSVTKSASPSSVPETAPGSPATITYTVTIHNDAPEAATIDSITDSVEGATPTDVAGTCDDLIGTTIAAGATKTCAFTSQVTGLGGDTVNDVVKVTLSDDEGNEAADDAAAKVTFTDVASSILVTKTANLASVPENGGPITYTVQIKNTSVTDTVTIGSLIDVVGSGSPFPIGGSCDDLIGTSLAPGATTSCQFDYTVSGNAGDLVTDTVTVTGTDDEGGPVSDSDDETVIITDLASSLSVTKAADVASLPEPGGLVTYTVQIKNTSVADSITLDAIVDSINGGAPSAVGGTCGALVGTTLAPGAGTSCTFTATVGTHTGDPNADTVTVSGTDDDDESVSGQGSESVEITDVGSSLAVTKTANVDSVPEPGGPVTYTLGITNTSQIDTITIGSIVDSVEGGTATAVAGSCDDLVATTIAPGETVYCSFAATVTGNAGDTVGDTVTVDGVDDDQQPVSAQGSEVVGITDVAPSLSITKTANPSSVAETAPGQTHPVTYTVDITNDSVETVTITAIVDAVEGGVPANIAGTCDDLIGTTLAAGASTSCEFTMDASGNVGDSYDDVATVTIVDDEQNQASDSDGASVTFTNVGSSIQVTKTADVASVPEPGGPVTYTVKIENISATDPVTITSITDSVDGGTAFPLIGDCGALVGQTLAPGATETCTFTMTVSGLPGDTVGDQVVVGGTDDEGNPVTDDGTEVVDVTDVESSLLVTKVANLDTVTEPGGAVTYTVTIENTSATDAITIDSITDSVDGGAAADVAGTCDDLIGTTLAAGATTTCTFTVQVSGDAGDTVGDTVVVGGTDDDDNPVSGEGSETVDISDVRPTITITKTASPSSVPETGPGVTREITYTVTIQNDSPETVTIDSISDSVEGAPGVPVTGTCDDLIGTTLAAQAGTSCTFTANVAGDAGGTVHDVVTVTVSDNEDNTGTDDDDATVTFTDVGSSLLVTKTADVGSVPEPGANVTYTVDITNTSAADSITIGSVTDAVNGGTATDVAGTCDDLIGTTLTPGQHVSCTFTVAVTGDAGDTVGDTVVVSGTDDDQQPVSDDGSESVDITDVASTMTVTKVANVDSLPENGGPVTYTVTIHNTSSADTITLDSITDSVDGGSAVDVGGTCDDLIGTTLAPGASTTCEFTVDVVGGAGDAVHDTVTVTGTDDDDAPVSGQGSEVVDITDVGSSLLVAKTANVDSVPEPGGSVTYTVDITNTSTTDVITIDSIMDSVDGGAAADVGGTCDDLIGTTLDPGEQVSCEFTTTVSGDAGDTVGDTVTVTGTDDDDNPVDGDGSEVVDITDVPPSGTVTKVADPASLPESGGTVTFSVSVTNTSAAESATITSITDTVGGDVLDATVVAGPITATTCATGTVLAPGETYTCTFDYLVPAGTAGDVITDTIAVTLTDNEDNDTTPTDTEEVPLTDVAPSIVVTKANDPNTVAAPGAPVHFDVTVENTSWEPVTITSLTDSVDGGTPFDITTVADPVTATTCETGIVIAAGDTYECGFSVVVGSDEAATVPDEVIATVVDDDDTEATSGDTAVTTVTAVADVSVDKRLVSDALIPGEMGTYELLVANAGPSTAASVTVVDTVPDGLVVLNASGEGWDCAIEGQVITCTRPELAADATSTISVDIGVSAAAAGTTVTNVVDVGAETDDPDATNNHDEEVTEVGDTAPEVIENPPTVIEELVRTGTSPGGLVTLGLVLVSLGGIVLVTRRTRAAARPGR